MMVMWGQKEGVPDSRLEVLGRSGIVRFSWESSGIRILSG